MVAVASWVFCIVAVALLLVTIAREPDTVPVSGPRIALMLIPPAVVLMLGMSAVRISPSPLAAGTFALVWMILSGLHPGKVWVAKGSPGRHLAFTALWIATAVWLTVWLLV